MHCTQIIIVLQIENTLAVQQKADANMKAAQRLNYCDRDFIKPNRI